MKEKYELEFMLKSSPRILEKMFSSPDGLGEWFADDVTVKDDPTIGNLLKWVNRVYNFSNVVGQEITATQRSYATQSDGSGYAGTGLLTLLDGCGYALEQWQLISCWPKSINFGDLDYSSSDECNIELSLRYSYAIYRNLCATTEPEECPSGVCSLEAAFLL
jgi:hypothetical protein